MFVCLFVVYFVVFVCLQLETESELLVPNAKAALKKYGHQVCVCVSVRV